MTGQVMMFRDYATFAAFMRVTFGNHTAYWPFTPATQFYPVGGDLYTYSPALPFGHIYAAEWVRDAFADKTGRVIRITDGLVQLVALNGRLRVYTVMEYEKVLLVTTSRKAAYAALRVARHAAMRDLDFLFDLGGGETRLHWMRRVARLIGFRRLIVDAWVEIDPEAEFDEKAG